MRLYTTFLDMCNDVVMPNIDEDAKAWQEDMSARIGRAIQAARVGRGLKVAQLSERTRELGYPIHRVAITKIETNHRAGKLDLAELIVLSLALGVPPVQLIYPELPAGPVRAWPKSDQPCMSVEALQWFSGHLAAWQIERTPLTEMSTNVRVYAARKYFRAMEEVREADNKRRNAQFMPHAVDMTLEEAEQAFREAERRYYEIKEETRKNGGIVDDG